MGPRPISMINMIFCRIQAISLLTVQFCMMKLPRRSPAVSPPTPPPLPSGGSPGAIILPPRGRPTPLLAPFSAGNHQPTHPSFLSFFPSSPHLIPAPPLFSGEKKLAASFSRVGRSPHFFPPPPPLSTSLPPPQTQMRALPRAPKSLRRTRSPKPELPPLSRPTRPPRLATPPPPRPPPGRKQIVTYAPSSPHIPTKHPPRATPPAQMSGPSPLLLPSNLAPALGV